MCSKLPFTIKTFYYLFLNVSLAYPAPLFFYQNHIKTAVCKSSLSFIVEAVYNSCSSSSIRFTETARYDYFLFLFS